MAKIIDKFTDFFRGIYFELTKVNWPSRRELVYLTFIVIVSTAVATIFISGVDLSLSKALEFLVSKK